MKKILLMILLLACAGHLYSQPFFTGSKSGKAKKSYIKGLQYRDLHSFDKAVPELKNAIKKDPAFIDAYMLLAEVYEITGADSLAKLQYEIIKTLNPDYYPAYYQLGMLAYETGAYQVAMDNLEAFVRKGKNLNKEMLDLTMHVLANTGFALESMKNPFPFNPISLGEEVNTNDYQYSPCLSLDGQTLFFTHRSPKDNPQNEDFYISRKKDGEWQKAENLGPTINTEENEGSASISADGRLLFFAAANRQGGYGSMDIYVSVREGEKWGRPINLGAPVNSPHWESQPSISSDGRTLYFTSRRPGGLGSDDIYMSRLDDEGRWSKPANLGPSINTAGIDQSPFIHADDQTLYFSTTGRIGMGDADLFYSRRSPSGEWQEPVNLGYPINTNKQEFSLIVSADGTKGYYAAMINETRNTDLFYFELYPEARPSGVSYVKGTVWDYHTKQKLEAKIELTDLETGKIVVEEYSDPVSGEFMFALQGNRDYGLSVSRDGYLFHSENFSLANTTSINPFLLDVSLMKLQVGAGVVLKNVFFETASYELKPESHPELNKLFALMNQNPGLKVELGGHTDSIGDKKYNQKLSENRAKAVSEYLVKTGVNKDRIIYKGYGDSRPAWSNDTPEGRALNRRTEFKIIGI
jgi:hypothetical protein